MGRLAALLLAIFLVGTGSCRSQTEARPQVRHLAGPLTFVDGAGHAVSTNDFAGKWLCIYMGYMHCADQCPLGLTVMGAALDEIGRAQRYVQPLFVTVDPERDRGEALTTFAHSFHEQLVGLTGTNDEIAAAAAAVGVVYRKAALVDDYSIDHSSSYSLIDPARTTVVTFKDAEPGLVAARIVKALRTSGADLGDVANLGAFR